MKNLKYIFISLIALIAVSCDKDGDFLTVNGSTSVILDGSGDIVLSYENAGALALTLYWTDNGELSLSNPLVYAPENATENTIQFSNSEDFATTDETIVDKGVYTKQYTVSELNAILSHLNYEGDVSAPLYIRIKSSLGDNMDPTYSNVLKINVTPYTIDMTVGYILDSNQAETSVTLYSPNSDGHYNGFMGVSGWYNFYLREGDGTIWGNYGEENNEFRMSKDDSKWNFWFPEPEGCYYVDINTQTAQWSALYIPSLSVTGDITGEMTYNRRTNKWTLSYTAASTGVATIQIAGAGKQYDVDTKTSNDLARDTTVVFGSDGSAITFGKAGDIAVNVGVTGEVSLVLDLSNPRAWTCEVTTGGDEQDEVAEYLYLLGINDGLPGGSWNFDNTIKLYNEDDLNYAALCNVNSLWGYQIGTEVDNWTSIYTLGSGDATGGTLVSGSGTNIPAPDAGLYLINVSLKYLTYSTMEVTSVQYSGINGDWSGLTEMTATDTPGTYTATIDITAASEWGFKVYLNGTWDYGFGASGGELTYSIDGKSDSYDSSLVGSTCTLTVDLCKCTYTLTAN